MRRLTAFMLPVTLALASGAFATPSVSGTATPSLDRADAPPERTQARTFTPEQVRRIAERVDRMSPRMRQAVLGRLAKMSDVPVDPPRVRRAALKGNPASKAEERRGLRDDRSRREAGNRARSANDRVRRGDARADSATPWRGKVDGRRDRGPARVAQDGRRDRGVTRSSSHRHRSAKRDSANAARDRDRSRGARTGKRAHESNRASDAGRRVRDGNPRLQRSSEAAPKISTRKRSSPSEGRRRD